LAGGRLSEAPETFAQPPSAARRSVLWRVIDGILLLAVVGMLVTVLLQIFSRLAGHSVPWTEELTRFLFLWGIFLGMASGFRTVEHARITFVLRWLPRGLRRLAIHLYVVLGIVFFSVVAYYGAILALNQYRSGQVSPALQIGIYTITLSVAISAVLAIVAHIQSAYFDPETRETLEGTREVLE
jgi:TRAP-type transport system small permease protein